MSSSHENLSLTEKFEMVPNENNELLLALNQRKRLEKNEEILENLQSKEKFKEEVPTLHDDLATYKCKFCSGDSILKYTKEKIDRHVFMFHKDKKFFDMNGREIPYSETGYAQRKTFEKNPKPNLRGQNSALYLDGNTYQYKVSSIAKSEEVNNCERLKEMPPKSRRKQSFEKFEPVLNEESNNYESSNNFLCPHCAATYAYKRTLNMHIKEYHTNISQDSSNGDITKPFQCVKCPDWFVSKYELNNHNKSVHGIAKEALPKSKQKQSVQNLENFDKIELILNENNVLLALNESEGKSPNQLASDENHKEDIKELPDKIPVFKCKICFEKFQTKSEISKHLTSVHEGKKVIKINGREIIANNQLVQDQIMQSIMVETSNDMSFDENYKVQKTDEPSFRPIQGQSWQTGFFESALTDRISKLVFFEGSFEIMRPEKFCHCNEMHTLRHL